MTTALLVLDLINDTVHPDSPMAVAAECAIENSVVSKTNRLANYFRQQGALIVFVKLGYSDHYAECSPKEWSLLSQARLYKGFQLGTWGTEYHQKLDARYGDVHIVKHRISPFYATGLEAILRGQGIERLVLTGVSTDYVVQSCAREAHDRDYEVIVIGDACAAATREIHLQALESLGRLVAIHSSDQYVL